MPIGNTYPPTPSGLQGDEKLVFFTTTDTYNEDVDALAAYIAANLPPLSETDPEFNAWLLATPPAYPGDIITDHNDLNNIDGGSTNYYHSDQAINIDDNVEFNSIRSTELNSTDAQRGTDSKFGTGIPYDEKKKFKLNVVYSAGDIVATIQFVGAYTTFYYYINNKKFIVTNSNIAAYTATLAATEGLHFFYINQTTTNADSPVITLTKVPWGIVDPDVLLWNFYFEATGNTIAWVGHEKHTYGRDIFQHARNHAQGAVYNSGLGASTYNGITNAALNTNTDNNFGRASVQIAGGYFYDEDIKNGIAHSDTAITAISPATAETDWDRFVYQFLGFTTLATTGTSNSQIVFLTSHTLVTGQAITIMAGNTTTVRGTVTITTGGTGTTFAITIVTGTGFVSGDAIVVGARIPIYYIFSTSGGNYIWRKLTTTDFLGVTAGAAITPSTIATATCQYNDAVSGGFVNMPTNNRYFPVYLMATNFTHEPVIAVLGQGVSTSGVLATALAEAPFQYSNLVGLNKLEIQEVVPFYRLSFLYNTIAGFNQNRMRLADATFLNVRVSTTSSSGLIPASNNDHALLSNRQWDLSGHISNQTVPKLAGFDVSGLPVYNDAPIPYFDATIGAGGDYADIAAAQTAGKYRLKAVGNITMSANTTISNNIYLDLNGYTMVCTTYRFLSSTGYLSIFSGIISFSYSNAQELFDGAATVAGKYKLSGIIFNNTSTVAGASIASYGFFDKCTFNLPNYNACCFGNPTYQANGIFATNCYLVGGGVNCYTVIYSATPGYSIFNNITLDGTFANNAVISCVLGGIFENILYLSSSTSSITVSKISNLRDMYGRLTVVVHPTITYGVNYVKNSRFGVLTLGDDAISDSNIVVSNSTVSLYGSSGNIKIINTIFLANLVLTSSANNQSVIQCRIAGTTTIGSDYVKLINSVCTGLLTLSSGAEYCDISHNTLTGGLTNSSGNSTNIIHDNF